MASMSVIEHVTAKINEEGSASALHFDPFGDRAQVHD